MKPTLLSHHDQAARNLADAALVCDAANVHWWVEAGTFLGLHRERGHFIPHDTDIDFGVVMSEAALGLVPDLERAGFAIHHVYGTPERGYEVSFKRNELKLDLFFFYPDGNDLWHAAWWQDKLIRFEFPRSLFYPLDRRTMEDVPVNAPNNAEKYLIHRYGNEWYIPRKDWRWWCDPCCINWEKSEVSYGQIT